MYVLYKQYQTHHAYYLKPYHVLGSSHSKFHKRPVKYLAFFMNIYRAYNDEKIDTRLTHAFS